MIYIRCKRAFKFGTFALFLAICLTQFFACNTERRIANNYIKESNLPAVQILTGTDLSLFYDVPQGEDIVDAYLRANFPFILGRLYPTLKDSMQQIFWQQFPSSMMSKSFTVFGEDDTPTFLMHPGPKYIIQILNMRLEEKVSYFHDETWIDDNLFQFDTLSSGFEWNLWFRIEPLNDTALASHTLFASFSMFDQINGEWNYDLNTGEIYYKYMLFKTNRLDLETFARFVATSVASYWFDYFLNQHIFLSMKPENPSKYYSWDSQTGALSSAGDQRFVFLIVQ